MGNPFSVCQILPSGCWGNRWQHVFSSCSGQHFQPRRNWKEHVCHLHLAILNQSYEVMRASLHSLAMHLLFLGTTRHASSIRMFKYVSIFSLLEHTQVFFFLTLVRFLLLKHAPSTHKCSNLSKSYETGHARNYFSLIKDTFSHLPVSWLKPTLHPSACFPKQKKNGTTPLALWVGGGRLGYTVCFLCTPSLPPKRLRGFWEGL